MANPQYKEAPPTWKPSELRGAKGGGLKLTQNAQLLLSQGSSDQWPPPPPTWTSSISQFDLISFYGAPTQCLAIHKTKGRGGDGYEKHEPSRPTWWYVWHARSDQESMRPGDKEAGNWDWSQETRWPGPSSLPLPFAKQGGPGKPPRRSLPVCQAMGLQSVGQTALLGRKDKETNASYLQGRVGWGKSLSETQGLDLRNPKNKQARERFSGTRFTVWPT